MHTRPNVLTALLCSLLATLGLAVSATAADLTIIDLRNRTAEELLPVLQPLVGADAALSGIDYKLLVRGSAEDVARVREAVAVLDRAPRQLIVSVRYNSDPQSTATNAGVIGTTHNDQSQVAVRAGTTISTSSNSSVSSVRVLEGNGAHISAGQVVPMVTGVLWSGRAGRRDGGVSGVSVDYQEFSSGFDVLPRVNGDRVLLDIATQQERYAEVGQAGPAVQRATTTVTGRLGEWIDLGGVTSSASERTAGVGTTYGTRTTTTRSDQRSIQVKVEPVE